MNTIIYIALLKNQNRIKINRATGEASDQSTDANVTRDPNNYLAPVAGGGVLHILVIAVMILIIVTLVINIAKQSKS